MQGANVISVAHGKTLIGDRGLALISVLTQTFEF